VPNLLAMSFEGDLSPSFDLRCLQPGRELPDGWGIGYYPGGEPSATVLKEPAPPPGGIRSELVRTWEQVASSVFVLHIRAARWGSLSDANTQPFHRSWGKRDWLFVHSGSLDQRLSLGDSPLFEPVGSTDTETIFCEIMTRVAMRQSRRLREIDPQTLHAWFDSIDHLGVLTCAITDGSDLAVYVDREGAQPIHLGQILPPYDKVVLGDDDLQIDLTKRGAKARKGVVLSTSVLTPEGGSRVEWQEVPPGSLVVMRQGAIVAEVSKAAPRVVQVPAPAVLEPTVGAPPPPPGKRAPSRPRTAPARRLEVRHRTVYRYDKPVERSTHLLRLQPYHDRLQRLIASDLSISVDGKWRDYDDVFGNRARRVVLDKPYSELAIQSRALVITLDTDPLELRPLHARSTIPLNWMPWQRHMLQPYLLPPELPDTQLSELHEYAMSFVERNGYDLVDSLLDMNLSIYKDYLYKQGATTVFTTPFEVYTRRHGVCQDFTNLFICLARLLGIPARYVCGYLYTGPKHENRAMAEATHAWAQVYLPELGWKGFDPTNGVLTQTDHIRVAVGRNYTDATPTSGTIFVGGGRETLEVDVVVEEEG
jgi:transglutaminase-like putative cysteine protease/predicted glutamine amidotransferase